MAGLKRCKVFISDDEKLLATKEPEVEGGLDGSLLTMMAMMRQSICLWYHLVI
jgi:hypothetical protein